MIRHIAIHVHSSVPLSEVQEALHSKGIFLREVNGRFIAEKVPHFLRTDHSEVQKRTEERNVIRLGKGSRR